MRDYPSTVKQVTVIHFIHTPLYKDLFHLINMIREIRDREALEAIIVQHRIGLLPLLRPASDNICEIEVVLVIIKNLQH